MENSRAFNATLHVSTDKQAESWTGLADQQDACQKWATKQGMSMTQIFIEEWVKRYPGHL